MARKKQQQEEYLTTQCRIKPKSVSEYLALKHMCRASKDIYNMGLYTCRQVYFENKVFFPYEKIYAHVKQSYPDYRKLHSQAAQQTLRKVHQDMMSFFGGLKESQGKRKVRLPKYKDKEGYFSTFLSKDCFKIENNLVRISLSKACKEISGLKFLYVPLAQNISGKTVKQVEIHPEQDGSWFSMCLTYIDDGSYQQVPKGNRRYLGIDLGVGNLVSMIDTRNCRPIIIDGSEIKSINRWYNKSVAGLKSIAEIENGLRSTKRIRHFALRRREMLKDRLHKISKGIVEYCVANEIEEIVVGKNPGWKQSVNIGKRNNQNFVQIPHSRLIRYLKYRCHQHGIRLTEQEESHTSKCDALSLEEVRHQKNYMGKRIKRGLFKSASGKRINADINGAINILRKSKGEELDDWVRSLASSGCVFQPWKLRPAGSRSLVLSVA
jgi:IS605 OrfB family transposase